jgi:proline iminopeptidase
MMKLLLVPSLTLGLSCWGTAPALAQAVVPDTSGYVEVTGARLYFRAIGNGTPLVVLHGGAGMSHDYLAPQMSRLLSQDFRLVYYDQRASGRSTGLEDTTLLTMAQFVEDLDAVREAMGLERMNLLGHSFGGLLAMYYAAAYPQRVEKLLLIDTSPASWELNFPYFRRTIAERRTEVEQRQMEELTARGDLGTNPATMDKYMKVFFRTFFHDRSLSDSLDLGIDEQWLANNSVTGRLVWEELGRYDIHDRLTQITAPTLLLHGSASVISLEGAEAIHARIPTSRLIVLDDVGHFPYIEAPRAFKAAVRAFVW